MAKNEKTSQRVSAIAAKAMKDPASLTSAEIKSLAASALTQAADKPASSAAKSKAAASKTKAAAKPKSAASTKAKTASKAKPAAKSAKSAKK